MRKLFLILAVVLSTASARAEEYGKAHGLLGPVVFGPKLSLLRLPTGPTFGAELKAWELVGLYVDYGYMPRYTLGKVTGEFKSWEAGLKVYPFGGRFFLGASYGKYNFSLEANDLKDDKGNLYSAKLSASPTFWSPRLGWLWSWESGFFMSLDLGWRFPLDFVSKLDVPNGLSSGDIEEAKKYIDKYGKKGYPNIGLLEFGFFF